MKVVLSTWGRFHFFHLARQFYKRNQLEVIFSTYPMFKLKKEGIPLNRIHSDGFWEVISIAAGRFGLLGPRAISLIGRWKVYLHDRYMKRRMPKCDIFIALSGSGALIGEVVQKKGGIYICERGSSHISHREDILSEEFSIWKEPYLRTTSVFIDREEFEYKIADRIVVPSSYAKRSFVACGVPAEKIVVNAYGAELGRFKKVAEPSPDEFVVLYVGGVRLSKGVPYLVEAFDRLKHPRKRLQLVGGVGGEMASYFRKAPMEGVTIMGTVPNDQLPLLMSRAHAFVLPSIDDGFGLVMAEAMACGCPVIGTTNTGAEDLFEDGKQGYIVPIRDPGAIASRLQELADDPDKRARLGRAAQARIKALGGWDSYGDRYETLCRALISGVASTSGDGAKA